MYVDDDWTGTTGGTEVGSGVFFGANGFASIQAAINAAAAGDTIEVAAGEYAETLSISKALTIVGAGAGQEGSILDQSGATTNNGVLISADGVSFSGFSVVGGAGVKYGIYASGRSNVTLSDLDVSAMTSSGMNLNGVTDFAITEVDSHDNGGAGIFMTDVKRGTLTDVTTSGNEWTGLGFSTAGRYHAIGVEDVVIAGASTFGESTTANGGIMFEESRWDGTAYDPDDPYPITYSTDAEDEADVTFAMDAAPGYVLSGPQDDAWSVRRRFYQTEEQGLAAAEGSPSHYLDYGRTLATVGSFEDAQTFVVAPLDTMSIQAAINAAAAGDTIEVAAGEYAEILSISKALTIVGAGAGQEGSILDQSGATTNNGVLISADGVSFSGFSVVGGAGVKYGIYAAGRSNVTLSDLDVSAMTSSGVNLNGVTDFAITDVDSHDNGGAGIFMTDVKRGTLTDVTTSGNEWTGLGFSTAGRYFAIGVEDVVIAGASTFGETTTANGGIMFEESRWDGTAYDPDDPYPITYSTDAEDEADVTFAMDAAPEYVLSGPQDDAWSVRRLFYQTKEQGLAAAEGSPTHYLDYGRTLATVGSFEDAQTFVVAPLDTMSIQAAINAAAAGDTIEVAAGEYAENLDIAKPITLTAVGVVTLQPASGVGVSITGAGNILSPIVVSGFTIKDADVGVLIHGETSVVNLQNLKVVGAEVGVQIAADAVAVSVALDGVDASGNGAGLVVNEGASVVGLSVSGSQFNGNDEDGILITVGATGGVEGFSVTDSSFIGNVGWAVAMLTAEGSSLDGVEINRNVIASNLGGGILIGAGATDVQAHFNRIVGNTGLALNNLSSEAVDAVHNWWGSNDGPGSKVSGLVGSAPYIVLSFEAPGSVLVGDQIALHADLNHDSTGADVSGLGTIPGELLIGFDGTLGVASPKFVAAVDGAASSQYTAGYTPGWGVLSATFDGAWKQLAVQVTAPTLSIAGPSVVDQGSLYTLSLTAGADAGVVSWWSIDWGDGTIEQVEGSPSSVTHLYSVDPATYTVRAQALTSRGVYSAGNELSVTVVNVAPTVVIVSGPSSVDQGTTATFTAVASDPGGVTSYAWTAKLGDEVIASGTEADFAFTPIKTGEYVVSIVVMDAHGAATASARELTVLNVAPTVELAAIASQVQLGSAMSASATATDPNPYAVLSYAWTVIYGGTVVATGEGPSFSYTTRNLGLHQVVVAVSDGEGGTTSKSATFEVVGIVGPVDPRAEQAVQTVVAQAEAQVQRQDSRIAMLTARYESNPSPMVQRMIQRAIQMRARIEMMAARRVAVLQRRFGSRN